MQQAWWRQGLVADGKLLPEDVPLDAEAGLAPGERVCLAAAMPARPWSWCLQLLNGGHAGGDAAV